VGGAVKTVESGILVRVVTSAAETVVGPGTVAAGVVGSVEAVELETLVRAAISAIERAAVVKEIEAERTFKVGVATKTAGVVKAAETVFGPGAIAAGAVGSVEADGLGHTVRAALSAVETAIEPIKPIEPIGAAGTGTPEGAIEVGEAVGTVGAADKGAATKTAGVVKAAETGFGPEAIAAGAVGSVEADGLGHAVRAALSAVEPAIEPIKPIEPIGAAGTGTPEGAIEVGEAVGTVEAADVGAATKTAGVVKAAETVSKPGAIAAGAVGSVEADGLGHAVRALLSAVESAIEPIKPIEPIGAAGAGKPEGAIEVGEAVGTVGAADVGAATMTAGVDKAAKTVLGPGAIAAGAVGSVEANGSGHAVTAAPSAVETAINPIKPIEPIGAAGTGKPEGAIEVGEAVGTVGAADVVRDWTGSKGLDVLDWTGSDSLTLTRSDLNSG
jgi:hypothetical protein